ncbi:hypothetical protein [Citromicrobium sp. JLT1363]|uniref:hypothetical protein n=1 Tax=Citromicrobium sp. JLT1363 TaxID=517722 RepID=UPI00031472E1|nr:hypothetical protein [Citromicrobium sp. JLT1363]
MPLWLFPTLMGALATISLVAGIWLLLHLPDVARIFRGRRNGEFVRSSGKKFASPGAVWLALILFNGGWIACVVLWVFVSGSDTSPVS